VTVPVTDRSLATRCRGGICRLRPSPTYLDTSIISRRAPRNPDASVDGRSCKPGDGVATYELRFSSDGASVTIVSGILSQEPSLTGTRREQSATRSRYTLDNAFASGELVLWPDGSGGLVAGLTIFGSGVPVVFCLEAPAIRVWDLY
jgi:hypothetical protein